MADVNFPGSRWGGGSQCLENRQIRLEKQTNGIICRQNQQSSIVKKNFHDLYRTTNTTCLTQWNDRCTLKTGINFQPCVINFLLG